jgi:hypothetical protein
MRLHAAHHAAVPARSRFDELTNPRGVRFPEQIQQLRSGAEFSSYTSTRVEPAAKPAIASTALPAGYPVRSPQGIPIEVSPMLGDHLYEKIMLFLTGVGFGIYLYGLRRFYNRIHPLSIDRWARRNNTTKKPATRSV